MIKNIFIKISSFFQAKGLGFEIGVILIFKIILLWVIWWAFFSHPIAKESRQQAVTQTLLTPSK
jgi:hypothetical protein